MKKKLLVIGLIVVLAFGMTACGGGDDEDTSGKTNLSIIDSEWSTPISWTVPPAIRL